MAAQHTHQPGIRRRLIRWHGVPVEVEETVCVHCHQTLGQRLLRRIVA
jgi:hypothetical protein